MKNVYIGNIVQEMGLYKFELVDVSKYKEYYNVIICSEDNMNTVEDIVFNIIDECPDIVFLYLRNNNWQLVFSIVRGLLAEDFTNIILVCPGKNIEGKIETFDEWINIISEIKNINDISSLSDQPVQLNEVIDPLELPEELHIASMKNGLDMYFTGMYYGLNYVTNIKHVEVEENTDIPFQDLSLELLNINNAFIYHVSKSNLDFYNKIKSDTVFSHVHQLNGDSIIFDNAVDEYKINLIKYSDYEPEFSGITYLKVFDNKDTEKLLEDINVFQNQGKLTKKAKLVNTCTWSNQGCGLTKLSRGKVDKELNFVPCNGCSQDVGKITDNYFDLLKNVSIISNKQHIKNDCSNCEANSYCSKCVMLPDNLSREKFCEIIKTKPVITDYIYKLTLFADMMEHNEMFQKVDINQIEISNMSHSIVYQWEDKNKCTKVNTMFTAFKLYNNYYIISYRMPKIIHTDKRFIFIAEAHAYDVPYEKIIEHYGQEFGIAAEEAQDHVFEAFKLMKEGKII